MAETAAPTPLPMVNSITKADVRDALRAGLADFQCAPIYGLFFGAVFSVVGVAISWALYQGEATHWIVPVAAGFPLIGPFAAVGLYEVSRRLEVGEELAWRPVLMAGFRQQNSQLPFFAVVTLFAFLAWIGLARVVYAISFGSSPITTMMTSLDVFFTGPGVTMLVIGTVVGAALAVFLFAISVVGVPLLLDRDIDVVTAMITSFKATVENREAMIYWGGIVGAAVAVAMLPVFLGMILVFPALGHASWHLYRRTIEPGVQ